MTSVKGLPVAWTSHLKDQDKRKKFEEHVRNAVHSAAWERLKELIDQKIEATGKLPTKLAEYDNPAWAYKQAHLAGYVSALNFVYDLINIKE